MIILTKKLIPFQLNQIRLVIKQEKELESINEDNITEEKEKFLSINENYITEPNRKLESINVDNLINTKYDTPEA